MNRSCFQRVYSSGNGLRPRLDRVRHEHIGCFGKTLDVVGIADCNRSLVPIGIGVHHRPIKPWPIIEERWFAAKRMTFGRLCQDHVGTEVREHARRVGAGQLLGKVKDAQV